MFQGRLPSVTFIDLPRHPPRPVASHPLPYLLPHHRRGPQLPGKPPIARGFRVAGATSISVALHRQVNTSFSLSNIQRPSCTYRKSPHVQTTSGQGFVQQILIRIIDGIGNYILLAKSSCAKIGSDRDHPGTEPYHRAAVCSWPINTDKPENCDMNKD